MQVQADKVGSNVVIFSRDSRDITDRFASIAQLQHELPARAAVLDGEVASDADERPNFGQGSCDGSSSRLLSSVLQTCFSTRVFKRAAYFSCKAANSL
jgi:hypothetical protein